MSKDLYNLLTTVRVVDVVVTVLLLATVIGVLATQRKKIHEALEHWRKKRNFEDTIMDSIKGLEESDRKMQERIDVVWHTMELARETSREIRDEMYSDIKDISAKLDDMEKKNNLSKQAELKSRIEKLYRECHANKVCTDTAFETLKDLIADYERHGGHNSFVHSLVQPEMYMWERIKTIPDPDAQHKE